MGCQSNVCSRTEFSEAVTAPSEVVKAAEALACLLADTVELQNFVRQARAVRLDDEVNEFLRLMNEYPEAELDAELHQPASLEVAAALEERLEQLPVVREYRQAERAARGVFAAVEEAISGAAGFAFAEQARSCAGT